MRALISKEDVKDILRNREQRLQIIQEKRISLYRELAEYQKMCPRDVLPAVKLSGYIAGGNNLHKDLDDVYVSYQRQIHQRDVAIREILWELKEREETIQHVWDCLYILEEVYYTVLYGLYVEGQLYTTVEAEHKKKYGISHMTFERYRKEGLEMLTRYYNSGCSIPELMQMKKMAATHTEKRTEAKREGTGGYTQINLLDIMGDEKRTEAKEGK